MRSRRSRWGVAARARPVAAGRSAGGLAAAVAAVLVAAAATGGPSAAARAAEDAGGGSAPATVGVEGLVDTLAGPGFCPQAATPVAGSRTPRAVAVDSQGRLQVETGPPDEPVIATITTEGQVNTRDSRIGQPTQIANAPDAVADTPAVAGRMVAGEAGAVLVAAGTRIDRLDPHGVPTTVAGDPTGEPGGVSPARSGDGGPAGQARFRSATTLARDDQGNLYVADHGGPALASPTVRFVNRTNQPVTFYGGTPEEVTVEAGHIATIAGTPTSPTNADGADGEGEGETERAREAVLHGTARLAVDGDALYITSAHQKRAAQARVAMVNLADTPLSRHGRTVEPGRLAVVAGAGETTIGAAGGIAASDGAVVIADPAAHRVHRLDHDGGLATLAGAEGVGSNVGGFDGNRQPAAGAQLNHPVDVAYGSEGQVYVTDRDNGQVRVIEGEVIRAAPGNGVGLTWHCAATGDDGGAAAGRGPRPGGPASVAATDQGVVYAALADAHQIIRRDPSGRITTVAGTGEAGGAGDGGRADQAQLDTPTAIALDPAGERLYVYDGGNARLRLVNLTDAPVSAHDVTIDPGAIATVAGTPTPTDDDTGDAGGGGGATPTRETGVGDVATPRLVELGEQAAAGFSRRIPHTTLGDLAIDPRGGVFVAEPRQHPDGGAYQPDDHEDVDPVDGRVRRLTPDGELAPVAGTGDCCADPAALAATGDRLYVADAATRQLWLKNRTDQPLTAHGHTIPADDAAVVAGTGTLGFTAQAKPATDADLLSPSGLAAAGDGAVYLAHAGIADDGSPGHYLHRLAADGRLAVTAGTGQPAYTGDTRPPRITAINLPTDLTLDVCGNLLIADAGNDRIRRLNLTGPCNPQTEHASPSRSSGDGFPVLAVAAFAAGAAALAGAGGRWHHHRRR